VPPAAGRGDAGQVSAEKLFTMIAAATVLSTLAILVEANGIPDFGSKPHILLVVVDVCAVHRHAHYGSAPTARCLLPG
jgi:hypothetical protein